MPPLSGQRGVGATCHRVGAEKCGHWLLWRGSGKVFFIRDSAEWNMAPGGDNKSWPPLSGWPKGKLPVTESVRRIADGVSVEWKISTKGVNNSRPPSQAGGGGSSVSRSRCGGCVVIGHAAEKRVNKIEISRGVGGAGEISWPECRRNVK